MKQSITKKCAAALLASCLCAALVPGIASAVEGGMQAASPEAQVATAVNSDFKVTVKPANLELGYGYKVTDKNGTLKANIVEGKYDSVKYQWYEIDSSKYDGTVEDGEEIKGETKSSFKIPEGKTLGTYYYYCEVKGTNMATSVDETGYSSIATVTVVKGTQEAPEGVKAVNETIKGTKDGQLTGLSTKMEYAKVSTSSSSSSSSTSSTSSTSSASSNTKSATDAESSSSSSTSASTSANSSGSSSSSQLAGNGYSTASLNWKDCAESKITNLEVGKYLVRMKETSTLKASEPVELEIKWDATSSVTVGTNAPSVKAPNLDNVALNIKRTSSDVAADQSVTIVLNASAIANSQNNSDVSKIKAIAQNKELTYFGLGVTQSLNEGEAKTLTDLGSNVIAIDVTYTTKDRNNIVAYRVHNNSASALKSLSKKPESNFQDGTYYVGNGVVTIYSSKFSTFALGYDTRAANAATPATGDQLPGALPLAVTAIVAVAVMIISRRKAGSIW